MMSPYFGPSQNLLKAGVCIPCSRGRAAPAAHRPLRDVLPRNWNHSGSALRFVAESPFPPRRFAAVIRQGEVRAEHLDIALATQRSWSWHAYLPQRPYSALKTAEISHPQELKKRQVKTNVLS